MKVKFVYKKGIVYDELPDAVAAAESLQIPKENFMQLAAQRRDFLNPPVPLLHQFRATGFIEIGKEKIKVYTEI